MAAIMFRKLGIVLIEFGANINKVATPSLAALTLGPFSWFAVFGAGLSFNSVCPSKTRHYRRRPHPRRPIPLKRSGRW